MAYQLLKGYLRPKIRIIYKMFGYNDDDSYLQHSIAIIFLITLF